MFGSARTASASSPTPSIRRSLTLAERRATGPYLAHTYVFKDGAGRRAHRGFSVRKIGFERFLSSPAVQQPLLYGIVCVMLALFTGWLGGVVFKR